MPPAVRSANNFSNGEIISFADEFTIAGNVAGEDLQVKEPGQNFFRVARAAHDLANRLLQWLDFDAHGATLSPERVDRQLACRSGTSHPSGGGLIVRWACLDLSRRGFCQKWMAQITKPSGRSARDYGDSGERSRRVRNVAQRRHGAELERGGARRFEQCGGSVSGSGAQE